MVGSIHSVYITVALCGMLECMLLFSGVVSLKHTLQSSDNSEDRCSSVH